MSNAARIDVPSIAKYRIHRAHWLPPNTSGRRPPNSLGSSNPLNTPTKVMAAREVAQPSVTSTVPSAVLSPPSRMAVHFNNSISSQKAGLRIPIARPRWGFRRVLVLVFTILSMVSVVYISVASANYLNYYPSLGSIDQQISSVVYRRDAVSNQTSIVSHIIVDNPTDYSGFTVKLFDNKLSVDCPLFSHGRRVNLSRSSDRVCSLRLGTSGPTCLDEFAKPQSLFHGVSIEN